MAKKFDKTNLLIGALFVLVSALFCVIGLRVDLDKSVYLSILISSVICGAVSIFCFVVGLIRFFILRNYKGTPADTRKRFLGVFDTAEKDGVGATKKIFKQNFFIYAYYIFLSVIGLAFFCGVSFCLAHYVWALICIPFAFVAVCPVWRVLEYLLKKERNFGLDDGIKSQEYPSTYEFFANLVEKYYGKKLNLKLVFSAPFILSVEKVGGELTVYLNEYVFFILNERQIESVFLRCYLQNNDEYCNKIKKAHFSREIFKESVPFGIIFQCYFPSIVQNSAFEFEFERKSLLRSLERRTDELLKGSGYEEDYLTAYKKFSVFEYSFANAKHRLNYELCRDANNFRHYINSVYEIFVELTKTHLKEWENCIENKLKAVICEKLTYKEKSLVLGVSVNIGEFTDNTTDEQKTLYDEYNLGFLEGTKAFYEPKVQQIEDLSREVFHYEQEPEKYTERLQLINIAHAYFTLARVDETEKVYKKIIESGDKTTETYFDYGAFLLMAKNDISGAEYIYKAMENENFLEDGLDILGKFLIYYGDENEYLKYCEYKEQKLNEFASEVKDRSLNHGASLVLTNLDKSIVDQIATEISKDENIEEIYCADTKTLSDKPITIVAFSVRNKTNEEAFINTYERIFSILDNDYGEYDTYLVAIDLEQDKNIIKSIKSKEEYLIFKR